MAGELLLDTGALVALLDASESAHKRCNEFYRSWSREIVTSEAVVTEVSHLLGVYAGSAPTALEFFVKGGALVVPWTLERARTTLELVRKYSDVPMDYADGTLVALADELGTSEIFTLDRRGFSTYRWRGRRAFTVHP